MFITTYRSLQSIAKSSCISLMTQFASPMKPSRQNSMKRVLYLIQLWASNF